VAGIKVIAFGGKGRGRLIRRFIWWKVWRQLAQINKDYQPIGILSFWLGDAAFIGNRFAKQKKLKHYSWLLGQDAKAGNRYVGLLKPKADELIAISDFVARQYHANFGIKPAHVIPVGVEAVVKTGAKRDIDILGAGSLISLKRYPLFAELVYELKKERPDVKAVICGDGPELTRLKAVITALELDDNLILKGELPHQQVLDLMQQTKVFVHPSEYEGFSTVCLEALYAGARVVSFIKPMDARIPNWQIANSIDKMLQQVRSMLDAPEIQPTQLPYPVADNVRAMMALFDYKD
jgi:glycosyltransferase involved in cell wall biosynthesis